MASQVPASDYQLQRRQAQLFSVAREFNAALTCLQKRQTVIFCITSVRMNVFKPQKLLRGFARERRKVVPMRESSSECQKVGVFHK